MKFILSLSRKRNSKSDLKKKEKAFFKKVPAFKSAIDIIESNVGMDIVAVKGNEAHAPQYFPDTSNMLQYIKHLGYEVQSEYEGDRFNPRVLILQHNDKSYLSFKDNIREEGSVVKIGKTLESVSYKAVKVARARQRR